MTTKSTKLKMKSKELENLINIRTVSTAVGNMFRLEIADIPIIPYLTFQQAQNTGIFMEKVVQAVIDNQKNPNPVVVEPLSSDFGMVYRLVICGVPLRAYISKIEADQEAQFLETVVSAIITKVNS